MSYKVGAHSYAFLQISVPHVIGNRYKKLGLSARASDRILKVGRIIADLAGEDELKTNHVAEAIQYRTIDRMQ